MTNLDYNVQADNLKCKQPEQNVEKSRSLVERARLEIVYTPQGYRGFESLLLRQIRTVILIQSVSGLRFLIFMLKHCVCGTFAPRRPQKKTRPGCFPGRVFAFAWASWSSQSLKERKSLNYKGNRCFSGVFVELQRSSLIYSIPY